MLTILSILIIYITLINAVILLAFFFRRKNEKPSENRYYDSVSVIVAFRNERENLPSLINALMKQEVEDEKFEVLLVDDFSTDGSFQVAQELIKDKSNFKVIRNQFTSGKKNALRSGIENAKNEILIFTDADCLPGSGWIKSILKNFDNHTDIVYGYSPFLPEKNFTNKLCRYENLFTSILMTAFQNVEYPYMSFGRNLAYRKSLFNKLGGFQEIEHSLSGDDDLFFQLALRYGAKAKLNYDSDSIVYSRCKMNFSEFIRRKSRHISASKFYSKDIKAVLGINYSSNILLNLILLLALAYFDLFLLTFIVLNWLLKLILIQDLNRKFNSKFPIYLLPIFDFIYFLTLIWIGIRSRLKVVSWK